ncbi:MAG: adenylate kinase [Armatimonadetes bacterium]|nr:adenylate kinase [Armatimonadota bacterium]
MGQAKRILVYGVTGSGKSTLAEEISRQTGIPCHLVDELCWLPNWVAVDAEKQRELIAEVCAGDTWILDSAYGQWIDLPLDRVELIIALDFPRWISLWRLLKRTLQRVWDRKPICNGNVETWRQALSRDSIIVWHFKSFKRKRDRIRAWSKSPQRFRVLVIADPNAI